MIAEIKTIFRDKNVLKFRNFNLWPLKIQNGQINVYCINMYWEISSESLESERDYIAGYYNLTIKMIIYSVCSKIEIKF